MQKDVWKEEWVRGERLPGGNQGHTFLARRTTDAADEFRYVLKTLRRQDDADRRARFHIEVACLRALDHKGVARLAGSNAADFGRDVELFIVTERIPGPGLDEYRRLAPVQIKDAAVEYLPFSIIATGEMCSTVTLSPVTSSYETAAWMIQS